VIVPRELARLTFLPGHDCGQLPADTETTNSKTGIVRVVIAS
jgi:hypothetical protein